MRLALPLVVGCAATAATLWSPSAASAVQINGWYRCSSSTLRPTGDGEVPDDEYYLQTKRGSHAKHHAAKKHARDSHATTMQLGRSAWSTPFLRDSLEFMKSYSGWHWDEKPHAHRKRQSNEKNTKSGGDAIFGDASAPRYECAEFRVPFCYEGICDSNRTMDVFVKRVVASKAAAQDTGRNKSLWVLQGGPGASSTAMEALMGSMYKQLEGTVSIYTMDHRGTARSNRLECEAAEAQMPGSPGGTFIVVDEVPNCISDILFQIDNQTAAFSVTSAAMDLRSIIDHSLSEEDVYVYGLSYGTYLVERLIHVAPKSVKGFIIDGIVSEAGASVEERSTYSNWDHDVGMVGKRFFGYCEADPFCHDKFHNASNLTQVVMDLYTTLDSTAKHKGENACADVLRGSGRRPSYFLRSAFGDLLMDEQARAVIPALVYRASRCSEADIDALKYFVDVWTQPESQETDLDDVLFTSQMLYSVIVFSEMWEYPSPSKDTLIKWYEQSVMGSDNYAIFPYYCLFTGSRESGCKDLMHLPQSLPMRYERDAYWNVTAELPANTTALLLSGGLDLQTRRMYGDLQYDLLRGDRMLVQFDYAGHCTTFTTPTQSGGPTCGAQILASYVKADGNLLEVDTSCVGDVFGLDFKGSEYTAQGYMGTDDLYE